MAMVIEPSLAKPQGTFGVCLRCGEKERTALQPGSMHRCFACGFSWHVTAGWPATLAETMVDLSGDCYVQKAAVDIPKHECGSDFYRMLDSFKVKTDHGLVFKLQCTSCGGVRQVILSE